jgi:uracil phosphoribosyltransferase
VPYYAKTPPGVEGTTVLLVDPMLATGGSADHAATLLERRGCREIVMIALVCAPAGVERMARRHPSIPIVAAALDRELDAAGRIRPGLGDAGDRLFGT